MRLKLDENLGPRIAEAFGAAGHDVDTVRDEHLSGAEDGRVAAAATAAGRALVTLDQGFGNILRFPSAGTPGIEILKPPGRYTPAMLQRLAEGLCAALATRPIAGRLWIVEIDRIREHAPPEEDDDDRGESDASDPRS